MLGNSNDVVAYTLQQAVELLSVRSSLTNKAGAWKWPVEKYMCDVTKIVKVLDMARMVREDLV